MSMERKTPLEMRSQIELYAEHLHPDDLDRGRIITLLQELSRISTVEGDRTTECAQELIDLIRGHKDAFIHFLREQHLHRKHDDVEHIKERVGGYEMYRSAIGVLRQQLETCLLEDDPRQAIRQLDGFVGAGAHGVYLSIPGHPDVIAKFIDPWIELEMGKYKSEGINDGQFLEDTIEFHLQMIGYARMKGQKHFAQMVTYSPEERVLVVERLHTVSHVDIKKPFSTYTTERQILEFADSLLCAAKLGIEVDVGKDDVMVDSQGNFFAVDYELFRTYPQYENPIDTARNYVSFVENFFISVLGSKRHPLVFQIAGILDDIFTVYQEKYIF